MQKFSLNDIRDKFLQFFEGKAHLVLPSFSLIPEKDKSLLLINSGMAPLKPYFTGQEKPPRNRIATCQKCIRTPDIDRVGKTARHGTFFEMLGNFSFGDYFKKEAIEWAWEFVTVNLSLPLERLWVSIYENDEEAYEIWTKDIGLPPDRVVRMGKADNFWEIGTGPCGPCSEIYFDRGINKGCQKPECKVGCDCDRYVEFWNLVFTQYYRDEQGNYSKLPNPNIDTGMGLERISAIMQDVDSLFDVDTIKNVIKAVNELSAAKYGNDSVSDVSIRVVADHARSMVFMISDGILPSNEGRGYVLRRIIRRASHHGRKLGIDKLFLAEIAKAVIAESFEAYKELKQHDNYILKIIQAEESRFRDTVEQGTVKLYDLIAEMRVNNKTVLSGADAFKLYDTYGFPFDLTKEILEEHGMIADELIFAEFMNEQRERARQAQIKTDFSGTNEKDYIYNDNKLDTKFIGYNTLGSRCKVISIVKNSEKTDFAVEGDEVLITLDETPFYPEGGGQAGDIGVLTHKDCHIDVNNVKKFPGNKIVHIGKIKKGVIKSEDIVIASVDPETRLSTARNHTATHLLHKALRTVLGEHSQQAGSLVDKERIRFDFRHFSALSQNELSSIEKLVNEYIMQCHSVDPIETSFDDAKTLGAVALFGEKYGDIVRVIKVGDVSAELCGGTHVSNSGQIGLFKIVSEAGIAAGIRRIEALTGWNAYEYTMNNINLVALISGILKTTSSDIEKRALYLMKQLKEQENEIIGLKIGKLADLADNYIEKRKSIEGISYIITRLDGFDNPDLRNLADRIKGKIDPVAIVLASEKEGKVNLVGSASSGAVSKGVNVGSIISVISKISGGGGGGRPDMAQAGGKDPSKINEALVRAETILFEQLGMK